MISAHKKWRVSAPVALATTLALVACAGTPPTAELRGARDSVARAQFDGAAQLAPQPFQSAQDKLNSAQGSVQNNNMDLAKNMAQEAQADADYADAVANAHKAETGATQLQGLSQKLQR